MVDLIAKYIGYVIIFTLLLYLLSELLLRVLHILKNNIFGKQKKRQDFYQKQYNQYINWTDSWSLPIFKYIPIGQRYFNPENQISPVSINKQGMRCIELDQVLDDAYKILFVGGSAAWGFGAQSNEYTIPGRLEAIIQEHFIKRKYNRTVQVLNLAQVNQTITQDLIEMVHYIPVIKPDIVIGINGWNELIGNMIFDENILDLYQRYPLNELVDWEPLQSVNRTKKELYKSLKIIMSNNSRLFNILFSDNQPLIKRSLGEAIDASTSIFKSHIYNADKIAKAFNAKYFIFLQPSIYNKPNLTKEENAVIDLYHNLRPILGGEITANFLKNNNIYNSLININNGENHENIYDLSNIFSNEHKHMFYSLIHCNDAGYDLIANKIFSVINKSINETSWIK